MAGLKVERMKADVQEPRSRLAKLEEEKSKLHKEMSTVERDIDTKKRDDEEVDRMRNEAIAKLRRKIEGYKDKKTMYEEKARVRLRLQNLLKELDSLGISMEVEDKVKSLLK